MRIAMVLLALFLLPSSGLAQDLRLLDLASRRETTLAQALPALAQARLVHVGESHGTLSHHLAQLEVVKALKAAGVKVVVGLEMLPRGEQAALDRYLAKAMKEQEFVKTFEQSWSDWPAYRPVFDWCRENGVAMFGLNVPRSITRKVAREGFASLTKEELGLLPPIACQVHPSYEAFLRRVLGAHDKNQDDAQFQRFCEAQLVWDTAMAVHALDVLATRPQAAMVVMTGSVHAWRPALPSQVRKLRPEIAQQVILPLVPGRLEPDSLTAEDADWLLLDVAD